MDRMNRTAAALVLFLIACLFIAGNTLGAKPPESVIYSDAKAAFLNDSLFYIDEHTGMSPEIFERGELTRVGGVLTSFAPVGGSWSFTLLDTRARYLKLDLYQSADAVFGSGELSLDSGGVVPVTAGGSIMNNRLALFVTPQNSQELYRFSLSIGRGSLSGNYVYTTLGITQPGVAFGSLISSLKALQGSLE